jgi:hypothetical protein
MHATAVDVSNLRRAGVGALAKAALFHHQGGESLAHGLYCEIAIAIRDLPAIVVAPGAAQRDVHAAGVALKTDHHRQWADGFAWQKQVTRHSRTGLGREHEPPFDEFRLDALVFDFDVERHAWRRRTEQLAQLRIHRQTPR